MRIIRSIVFVLLTSIILMTPLFSYRSVSIYATDNQVSGSLQDMISKAESGSIVVLDPGVYYETLTINKPLEIIALGVSVMGDGRVAPTVTISADGTTLRGLTISGENTDSGVESVGLRIESDNNRIQDCIIENYFTEIHLEDSNNNTLINNTINGIDDLEISEKGSGILFEYSNNNLITKNIITNVCDGAYLYYSNGNTISENTVTESRYAVHIMDASGFTRITDNFFIHNITGVMTMLAHDTLISGNEISDQYDYHGSGLIIYDSVRTTVNLNIISKSTVGIQLDTCSETTIYKNTIRLNSMGLLILENVTTLELYENNFLGNVRQAVLSAANPIVLYSGNRGNYWDDYRGFDFDGDGIGSRPYHISRSYFDQIISMREELQLFFKSPVMDLLETVKSFDTLKDMTDSYPLTKPVPGTDPTLTDSSKTKALFYLPVIVIIIAIAFIILWLGRSRKWGPD